MGSRRDKIRKFLLEEQEEDDELFFVLVPALYSALYEEKRPVHTSSLTGAMKRKRTQVLVEELKEPKEADKYSIANCVAALEPMEDLSVVEKSNALRLFKCQLNREIFLNTKDSSLRIFWLKDEIAAMQKK